MLPATRPEFDWDDLFTAGAGIQQQGSDSDFDLADFTPEKFFNSLPKHRRPTEILTVTEATRRVNEKRQILFATWGRLRQIVNAHESTIRKRWAKRTSIKRRELLCEVQPDMPNAHAPEVRAIASSENDVNTLQEKRDLFLLPYLNLVDLSWSNGIKLLSLLHHRAYNFPSAFARFDFETLVFGLRAGAISRVYVPDLSMLSFGDQKTYGKLIGWCDTIYPSNDAPSGQELSSSGADAFTPADGLAILEAQIKLIEFLLRVVGKILVDQDLNSIPPYTAERIMPPPEIPLTDSPFGWMSVVRNNVLRPFLAPTTFSFSELGTMIETGYDLAVDHLIELRTEPAYLSEQLSLYLAHRIESMGSPPAPQMMIQERAIKGMLSSAYEDLIQWHLAKSAMAKLLKVVKEEYPEPLERGRRIPENLEQAFQELYAIFESYRKVVKVEFPKILASSQPMRKYIEIKFLDSRHGLNNIVFKFPEGDDLTIILRLLLDDDQTQMWQTQRLLDQIDQALNNGDQHSRITPLVALSLSQLGTFSDIMDLLQSHRPTFIPMGPKRTKRHFLEVYAALETPDVRTLRIDTSLARFAFPTSRFLYPTGPKTMEWAQRCELVDSDFKTFWDKADDEIVKRYGRQIHNMVRDFVGPCISNVDWRAIVATKPTKTLAVSRDALLPFGGAETSPCSVENAPIPPSQPKKKKTKGNLELSRADQSAQVPAPTTPESAPAVSPISVTSRVYKMFSMLFRSTDSEQIVSQTGTIPWSDILMGFTQIGFGVVKKRGSIWRFDHPDGRNVNVHEPHPGSKLSFWGARRLGRRLNRRFGWTGDWFKLA